MSGSKGVNYIIFMSVLLNGNRPIDFKLVLLNVFYECTPAISNSMMNIYVICIVI